MLTSTTATPWALVLPVVATTFLFVERQGTVCKFHQSLFAVVFGSVPLVYDICNHKFIKSFHIFEYFVSCK
jgi:hypothetical protein